MQWQAGRNRADEALFLGLGIKAFEDVGEHLLDVYGQKVVHVHLHARERRAVDPPDLPRVGPDRPKPVVLDGIQAHEISAGGDHRVGTLRLGRRFGPDHSDLEIGEPVGMAPCSRAARKEREQRAGSPRSAGASCSANARRVTTQPGGPRPSPR